MCDITTAALVLSAAGTGTQVYGQYQSGRYQSDVMRNNAIIQRRMADDAQRRGENEENRHRMKVAQLKSRQRAQMAAKGLDISQGTPSLILEDTAEMGELDALTIRNNAEREVYGLKTRAQNTESQADVVRQNATMSALGTLMTGGGQVASDWYAKKPPKKKSE